MYDLVIRNGSIIDGTGASAYDADVAVQDGCIVEIGPQLGPARREIDATGRIVTPGFVDAHTHYDGQATWDPELSPSSWHGVTTVVMGNCGVGFAPARPSDRGFLISTMESVEEIPAEVIEEGVPFDWESFPEYLDSLERMPRSIDVAAQMPHCALRAYVMGEERAFDDEVSDEDIAEMTRLTREALDAGALGFSTSRTFIHRTKDGRLVPGTSCAPRELLGIADALRDAGHGVFQLITDDMGKDPDYAWMKEVARTTGRPVAFTLSQRPNDLTGYRDVLAELDRVHREEGLEIWASVPWRPAGILLGLQATLNPFRTHPCFRELGGRKLEEIVAVMRTDEFRARLLGEEAATGNAFVKRVLGDWENQFVLGDPPDYEPPPSQNIAALAKAAGVSPAEYAYDVLLRDEGRQFIYYPLASYASGNLDVLHEMMTHPRATASGSDGGAHVGTVCDASAGTFMLTHWARDRSRGPRVALEEVIRKQTSETARLYGLLDRGVIAPGKKADLNVIDFDALELLSPYMASDLPSGAKRLLQRAEGYDFTIVAGEIIAEGGAMTDARPGRLVRGPQG